MMLPAGFVYAYPGGRVVPCIRRSGADRMLCGLLFDRERAPGFAAETVQPVDPDPVCPGCVEALASLPDLAPALPEEGWCPVCHGEVPVVDGLVAVHGKWTVGRHGPRITSETCDGVGMAPEVAG